MTPVLAKPEFLWRKIISISTHISVAKWPLHSQWCLQSRNLSLITNRPKKYGALQLIKSLCIWDPLYCSLSSWSRATAVHNCFLLGTKKKKRKKKHDARINTKMLSDSVRQQMFPFIWAWYHLSFTYCVLREKLHHPTMFVCKCFQT